MQARACKSLIDFHHSRITNAKKAPIIIWAADTAHLPASACMFSKGLPLPLAGGSVSSDPDSRVEDGSAVGAGLGVWAVGLGEAVVDKCALLLWLRLLPPTVDVTMLPVLMEVGPMTIGTMICKVFPALSVVVSVMVVLTVLMRSSVSSLEYLSVVMVVVVGGVGAGAGVDVSVGESVLLLLSFIDECTWRVVVVVCLLSSEAAEYALSMT